MEIRPTSCHSGVRVRTKPRGAMVATLWPDATWRVFSGPLYFYTPIELVGPTVEAIASFAQLLRDTAPHVEGGCCTFGMAEHLYSTLDRRLVVDCVMLVEPRTGESVACFGADEDCTFAIPIGPLPSLEKQIADRLAKVLV